MKDFLNQYCLFYWYCLITGNLTDTFINTNKTYANLIRVNPLKRRLEAKKTVRTKQIPVFSNDKLFLRMILLFNDLLI